MKKSIFFMGGILALVLVFALFLTGCPSGDEETVNEQVSNNVSLSGISNPNVTARVVFDGVILTWPPIIEANSYAVWRSGGGQDAPIQLNTGSNTVTKQTNGLYQFYDQSGVGGNVVKTSTQYTYTVLAIPYSSVKDIGKWESTITTDPPLFGNGSSLTVTDISPSTNIIENEDGTVIGYFAAINLGNLKQQPNVTYTIERALLGTNDIPGTYYTVSLSKSSSSDVPVGNLTPDYFGNFPFTLTAVYDRGLPAMEGKYLYRIKGVKDSTTEYIYCTTVTTLSLTTYLLSSIYLTISTYNTPVGGGDWYYNITPSFTAKKGMLQDNDKVVLYWLIGDTADCYIYGPYSPSNSITITKSNLENTTIVRLNVTPKTSTKYLYVQAWLERANGDKKPLSTSGTNWTISGAITAGPIQNNGQYHVMLTY